MNYIANLQKVILETLNPSIALRSFLSGHVVSTLAESSRYFSADIVVLTLFGVSKSDAVRGLREIGLRAYLMNCQGLTFLRINNESIFILNFPDEVHIEADDPDGALPDLVNFDDCTDDELWERIVEYERRTKFVLFNGVKRLFGLVHARGRPEMTIENGRSMNQYDSFLDNPLPILTPHFHYSRTAKLVAFLIHLDAYRIHNLIETTVIKTVESSIQQFESKFTDLGEFDDVIDRFNDANNLGLRASPIDEVVNIFTARAFVHSSPSSVFFAVQSKYFKALGFTELFETMGVTQDPRYHADDVFLHSLKALDYTTVRTSPRELNHSMNALELKIATLAHDIGKARTRREVDVLADAD